MNRHPFTIQLLYESTEYVQDLELTVDSGYIESGFSLKSENREYFSAEFIYGFSGFTYWKLNILVIININFFNQKI